MADFQQDLDAGKENAELLELTRRLSRSLEKERRRNTRLVAAVDQAIRDSVRLLNIPEVPEPEKDRRRRPAETAVALLADWQLGKVTPDYNSDIAEHRVKRLTEETLSRVRHRRQETPIRDLHVWVLGDIVEGEDIFPGQAHLIDSSLYSQVFRAGRMLAEYARVMAADFDRVHLAAVIGNHGRVGRRGQMHHETNTDRMAYKIAEELTEPEPRISWEFAEPGNTGDRGWYTIDHIGAYSCLLVHGDQFRGSLGIPWYGVRKKVLGWKAMAAAGKLPFPDFLDVAHGHWHQDLTWDVNGITIRGAGSPESHNDYAAENLAGMSRPSQRILFVNPKVGEVTAEQKIWLDG